jgi:hypothetical protein
MASWRRTGGKRSQRLLSVAGAAVVALAPGCGRDLPSGTGQMSFFITSERTGSGGNLNGLAAADLHCQTLAGRTGSTKKEWRAYLSTAASGDHPGVNARDRIGRGPWVNARGFQVAATLEELHGDAANLHQETALDERGEIVRGTIHDILTGSTADGMSAGEGLTCENWTSTGGAAMVGHHNRQGGGDRPRSWNSAHASRGCSLPALESTGGDARFYCFAID